MKVKKMFISITIIISVVIGSLFFVENVTANRMLNVKVCSVARNINPSAMELACEGNFNQRTTITEMYAKGWRFVGSIVTGNGAQVILEK